jgi:uncharacterized protein
VTPLDGVHEMIASGWSNRTPWDTHREEDEDQLKVRYEAMICQLKDPRNASSTSTCRRINPASTRLPNWTKTCVPCWRASPSSRSARPRCAKPSKKHQPLLGLHGHIHEGRGATRIGKTLCINPGSMYEQGTLLGAIVAGQKQDRELRVDHRLTFLGFACYKHVARSQQIPCQRRSLS